MTAKLQITGTPQYCYFEMFAPGGERILRNIEYESEDSCRAGLQDFLQTIQLTYSYDKRKHPEGGYYFVVRDTRFEILASSDLFHSASHRDHALMTARKEAPDAIR